MKQKSNAKPKAPRVTVPKAKVYADIAAEEKATREYHKLERQDLARISASSRRPVKRQAKPRNPRAKMLQVRAGKAQPVPDRAAAPITRLFLNSPIDSVASSSSSVALDTGAVFSSALALSNPWTSAVFNGVAEGDCRYPDPFTLAKTSILQTRLTTISAPSTVTGAASDYEGFTFGMVKGSGVYTYGLAKYLNYANYGAAIAWDDTTATLNWYTTSAAASTQITRPNGIVLSIKPLLRGIEHSVSISAFPIAPINRANIAANPAGWPATVQDLFNGITSPQASWGGRQWTFNPTDEAVRLVTLPIDARSLDFTSGSTERTGYSGTAGISWTGWVFWISGLNPATDLVHYSCNTVEELINTGQSTVNYAYPASVRKPNVVLAEKSVNEAVSMANSGAAATKWTSVVWEAAKKAGGYALDHLIHDTLMMGDATELGLTNAWNMQNAVNLESVNRKRPVVCNNEEKSLDDLPLNHLSESTKVVNALTDPPEMVTPKNARRPSLTLSLTSRKK